MSSKTIALVAILTVSLFWASAGVVAKILLKATDPFTLAFWRFLVASIAIVPFFLKQSKKIYWKKLIVEVGPIALLSTGNIAFFYLGLQTTTNNAAAIIYTSTPLFAMVFASLFIKETLTGNKIAGILLGFIGAIGIVLLPLWETGKILSGDLYGNFLISIASVSWALYTVYSRRLITVKSYSPLDLSTVSIVISTLVFFPLMLLTSKTNLQAFFTSTNILLLTHLGIVVTVFTYLLYQWAIKHSSATTASLSNYIQPVLGITLGIVILGEPTTLGFVIGGSLVMIGVFLATGSQTFKELKRLLTHVK